MHSGMLLNRAVCKLVLLLALLVEVRGHGGLVDPPMRSFMWKEGFDTPVNYDWNSLYCGGFNKFKQSGGKCGLCGDPFDGPFENDRGGVYDTGMIVRHYPHGLHEIQVKVEITAHHKGYIVFKLCPNNEQALTKACLDRYPLVIREAQQQGDPYRYRPPPTPTLHELHVLLPPDVTCDRCVLQWTYTAGNSAGRDPDGTSCIGCGLQETFVNCADISIGGTVDSVPVANHPPAPVEELVIPLQTDIMELIRNAPPETPMRDILTMAGGSHNAPRRVTPEIQRQAVRQPRPMARRPVPPTKTVTPKPRRQDRLQVQTKPVVNRSAGERNRVDTVRRQQLMSREGPPSANRPRNTQQNGRSFSEPRGRDRTVVAPLRSSPRGSSMLDSVGRTIDQIRTRGPRPEPFRPNMQTRTPTRRLSPKPRAPFIQTGLSIFGTPRRDMITSLSSLVDRVPTGVQWRRGDGRTSHRDAVRHGRTLGRMDLPLEVLQQHVPDLPLDMLPRQDIDPVQQRRASAFSDNWFPESRGSRTSHSNFDMMDTRSGRDIIPRRIVVQSMVVAQDLLRKYPQLRGRVFLSPEAHARNMVFHMSHKYRRRQRWLTTGQR